ncbi:hypothetical protein G7Y89_g9838 [Cudoniella acicularis]|uniref:Uncharacterized protein n=1 Tax=Cudoniella acicularis TaxID=354080 RepID=A0A8H4REW8_9HELO|nr:hypothetical protein G7Y89_g9838 [Cudoniella acicularis]
MFYSDEVGNHEGYAAVEEYEEGYREEADREEVRAGLRYCRRVREGEVFGYSGPLSLIVGVVGHTRKINWFREVDPVQQASNTIKTAAYAAVPDNTSNSFSRHIDHDKHWAKYDLADYFLKVRLHPDDDRWLTENAEAYPEPIIHLLDIFKLNTTNTHSNAASGDSADKGSSNATSGGITTIQGTREGAGQSQPAAKPNPLDKQFTSKALDWELF